MRMISFPHCNLFYKHSIHSKWKSRQMLVTCVRRNCKSNLEIRTQGAKKITFTACHSGKLKLAFTSPDVISTSPKNEQT